MDVKWSAKNKSEKNVRSKTVNIVGSDGCTDTKHLYLKETCSHIFLKVYIEKQLN